MALLSISADDCQKESEVNFADPVSHAVRNR